MKDMIIGVDLAKRVFQIHGSSTSGEVRFRKKLTREQFRVFMARQAPGVVVFEACGSASYWAREMGALGHEVTFALHAHDHAEVYFGLEGEGDVMIDGQPHRLAPGVALFIPGGAIHGVPLAAGPLKWFYTFAADGFANIRYRFPGEAG